MEYLKVGQVVEANKEGIRPVVEDALSRLERAQRTYPTLIMEVVRSGDLEKQIDITNEEMRNDPNSRVGAPLAAGAGAYFLNENIIAGSRERPVVESVNRLGTLCVPGWQTRDQKIKLGPGIGFVEAPSVYRQLINIGLERADLTVNYTAPFGNAEATGGIRRMMDARIDPERNFFPETGVFLTQGATEAVDLFMEAMAVLRPGSRVVFPGLSYYTGPYSAIQKGLRIDRLVADPLRQNSKTRFFPTAEEMARSLAKDTSALFLTSPNNPNGETYPEPELRKLMTLLKERGIFLLFDALFENMYFNREENYRSKVLQIANESGALDRIAVADGLSKTKNFPGERIGFLATTNQELSTALINIVLARRCNPRLILGPIVQFEGLARQVKSMKVRSPATSLSAVINKAMQGGGFPFDRSSFEKMYTEWSDWEDQVLEFYQGNLAITRAILNGSIDAASPDRAAFNTFVRLANLDRDTNCVDFMAKLMFTTAVYTQVGPCFGISQKVWNEKLGVWPRITYACSRRDLTEGLVRMIIFTRLYAERNFGNPNRFPVLNITYEEQV